MPWSQAFGSLQKRDLEEEQTPWVKLELVTTLAVRESQVWQNHVLHLCWVLLKSQQSRQTKYLCCILPWFPEPAEEKEMRSHLNWGETQPSAGSSMEENAYKRNHIESQNGLSWRDLKTYPMPATLSLSQVAPSSLQSGPGHFQGWGIQGFSGHTVTGPRHPHLEQCDSTVIGQGLRTA